MDIEEILEWGGKQGRQKKQRQSTKTENLNTKFECRVTSCQN